MHENITYNLKEAFKELIFEEGRHLYFLKNQNLISVSKKVEQHSEKFVPSQWLPRCAAKASREEGRVVTEQELAHKWQTINKTACDLGHETHDYLEHFNGLKTAKTPQEIAGVKFLRWLLSETFVKDGVKVLRYTIVAKELRMYSKEFWYAGTSDLTLYDNKLNTFIVVDYKTNANLFKTHGWLKAPFDELEGHPYNKYQLQLSYYQIMLEEKGYDVGERWLVFLKADGEYHVFNTYDFTNELKQYMRNTAKTTVIATKTLW